METLSVAWTFFKIGIIAFGGGWSTVGIIKNAVVPLWIDEENFRSLIAIAQSTPGPIALNSATMIGWNHGGMLTAIVATLSVVAFPVLMIALTTLLASKVSINKTSINEALRTGSIAMMLMTLWVLRPTSMDPLLLLYAVATFAIGAFTKINTLWAILGAGAFNALLGPALRSIIGL
ncbi:MAG: chromate transporter [Spirochaetales bacterium]|nr:chromate transporter [Spirochaetales bacterium]